MRALRTVTASTMIARLRGAAQGQMSLMDCGNFWESTISDLGFSLGATRVTDFALSHAGSGLARGKN